MQVLGPADQPFLSEDSILSFALYLACHPFYDDAQPCVNHYTIDLLKRFGYKGMLPSEAALKAVKEKHRGVVSYIFRMPDSQLLEAYDDQKQVLLAGEGEVRTVVKQLMTEFQAGARGFEETMMRLVCTIIHMRAEFLKMWQQLEPLIRVEEPVQQSSEEMVDGSKLISHNGFKFIGARANAETQKRLGLC